MASLEDDIKAEGQEGSAIKALLLGHSGAGKTGVIGSLARSHRLFIYDFDNGTKILRDPKIVLPEWRKNIFIKHFYDKTVFVMGKAEPEGTAFDKFNKALADWKEEDGKSLGNIYSWGPKDVIVLDSFSFLANIIQNSVLKLAGRSGGKPQIQDIGAIQDALENVLETLYNPAVKANVVITAHLTRQADDLSGGLQKLMISTIGKKLAPKIARYFNNTLLVEQKTVNKETKPRLITKSTFDVDLKTERPSAVQPEMDPDLDKLFTLLRGVPASPQNPTAK
ncbi:MAG TPA: AAA family ATPase [Terriglobia bacterium]|nr:AAA family ATPase [Terriglobia bacterium]